MSRMRDICDDRFACDNHVSVCSLKRKRQHWRPPRDFVPLEKHPHSLRVTAGGEWSPIQRTGGPQTTMNINFSKLNRLEEASRQAHAVLLSVMERRDEARSDFYRRRDQLRRDSYSAPPDVRALIHDWLDRGCPSKLPEFPATVQTVGWTTDGTTHHAESPSPWLSHVAAVADRKVQFGELEAEHRRVHQRWESLSACLPALRDFARQYGRRTPNQTARLANEATLPDAGSDVGRAHAGYAPPEQAAAAAPTGGIFGFWRK
jgi:hypothetical protein